MRLHIEDIEAEFQNSGSADLGWFIKLYCGYGSEEKFWEQIKADHAIVNLLAKCAEEDGFDQERFMEGLDKLSDKNPLVKEIMSGYVKEVPHLDGNVNWVPNGKGGYKAEDVRMVGDGEDEYYES